MSFIKKCFTNNNFYLFFNGLIIKNVNTTANFNTNLNDNSGPDHHNPNTDRHSSLYSLIFSRFSEEYLV